MLAAGMLRILCDGREGGLLGAVAWMLARVVVVGEMGGCLEVRARGQGGGGGLGNFPNLADVWRGAADVWVGDGWSWCVLQAPDTQHDLLRTDRT